MKNTTTCLNGDFFNPPVVLESRREEEGRNGGRKEGRKEGLRKGGKEGRKEGRKKEGR